MTKIIAVLSALLLAVFPQAALTQSSPGWGFGYVPTPAEWNAAFAAKQDYGPFPFLSTAGGTMLGPLVTAPSSTAGAGFSIPPGTAPTSPANGNFWTTASGVFAQIGGSTVNLLQTSPFNAKVVTGNYTLGTLDCGYTVQETGAFATITIPSAAGFTNGCLVTIYNGHASRGQFVTGAAGIDGNILYPRQSFNVQIINSAWVLVDPPGRWQLAGAATVYVDVGLGSDSNDCLAAGAAACATYQAAQQKIWNYFDTAGQSVTIQGANGTFSGTIALNVAGSVTGGGSVTLDCANQTLNGSNLGLQVLQGAVLNVQNCVFSGAGGIEADNGGIVIFTGSVACLTVTVFCLAADRPGSLINIGTATVTFGQAGGSSQSALHCSHLGNIRSVGGTLHWTQNATYTVGTIDSYSNGDCTLQGMTITVDGGVTITGYKFHLDANAAIYTATNGNLSLFPGTLAGYATGGGSYDNITVINGTYADGHLGPGCSTTYFGNMVGISDSTTDTWGAAVTVGGGLDQVIAVCDGTNYTVVGK
jgi:hypothetical protein